MAPLISIQGQQQTKGSGKIMLTDVLLTPVDNLAKYLWFKADSNADIIPQSALVSPGVSPSELTAQGYLEMAQSKLSAEAAALTRLDYPVGATPDGALVTQVGANAPASGVVSVADIITGVNGQAVTNTCGVISDLHTLDPGTKVTLTIRPATIHPNGSITNGSPVVKSVVLGKSTSTVASGCPGVEGPSKAFLGVALQDDISYSFPLHISISTPNIGGPSAGLAMTLGIIDELSGGTLVKGKTLAATGTIDPEGNVGDVGGVPQKTIAVAQAGASVFFVPQVEREPALSKAPASLKIVAVSTLNQVLNQLLASGGTIKLANGTRESRTSVLPAP